MKLVISSRQQMRADRTSLLHQNRAKLLKNLAADDVCLLILVAYCCGFGMSFDSLVLSHSRLLLRKSNVTFAEQKTTMSQRQLFESPSLPLAAACKG